MNPKSTELPALKGTARDGRAPILFVIGAPKCGTTTLDAILRHHPQVYMSSRKEPRFFSRDSQYAKGFDWYLDAYFHDAAGFLVRGEATPTYLYWHAKAIPRMKLHLGGLPLHFIAILRNPIDRAYSHYWMNRTMKTRAAERQSFADALAAEDDRIKDHPEWNVEGTLSYHYFRTGLYAEQLQAYFGAFGRENCLVLLFEELQPQSFNATVRKMGTFLGLSEFSAEFSRNKESRRFRSKLVAALLRLSRPTRAAIGPYLPSRFRAGVKSAIVDANTVPFNYPAMDPSTRQSLVERYRPSIRQLEDLLGQPLTQWRDWNSDTTRRESV